jgi:hypothetical protein
MEKLFVPYSINGPAAVDIKGHRLLIISTDQDDMQESLPVLGGSEVREIDIADNGPDETTVLAELAAGINGGVVLAPPGIPLSTMLYNLERELPWIQ